MAKKKLHISLILVLCLVLPVLACAWQLETWVRSGGGQIQVGNSTVYTVSNGAVFKTYTTQQNIPITITPSSGYKIAYYSVNDPTLTNKIVPADPTVALTYQMGLPAFPGNLSQSLLVGFTPWYSSITSVAGNNNGSVSPAGTFNLQVGSVQTYTFTPSTVGQVVAITGLPASGYTLTPATLPAPVNTKVTLALTVPSTPLTITGYFLGVVAEAGPPQYVRPGTAVTLDGTGSVVHAGGTTLSYAWAQNPQYGVPTVTLNNPASAKPSFTPPVAATYNFTLTVSNGAFTNSDTSYTVATNSAAATARSACQNCHQGVGVGASQNVFANWSSSQHEQQLVMCALCHVGSDTGGHPGNLGSGTVNETTFTYTLYSVGSNFCFTCHHKPNNLHYNTEAQLANICTACHLPDVHNPLTPSMSLAVGRSHFNGYSSPVNPGFGAAYVTSASRCANCHLTSGGVPDAASDPALLQERVGWAASGHGDTRGRGFVAANFKALSGCVQCHTAPGFIAYSTAKASAAWGSSADSSLGVLSCDACHSDLKTGALRSATPLKPYPNDGYLNPDLATSNLCVRCHSGVQSGRSIKALAAAGADFSNQTFTGSHSSAAAGILLKSAGYQFGFRNYSNSWHFKHDKIGINGYKAYGYDSGSAGPCVGCHMSSANNHSFSSVARDASGVITSLTGGACGSCHSGPAYLDAGRMNAREAKFAAALAALQKVLEGRGIYYSDTAPYFFRSAGDTTPGNAVTNWGNADTMGAAFNFNLLQHEPGAYAHNMIYSKRLVYDSIDYLDNGVLDGSVSATINGLATLNATQKATALGYLAPSGTRP